MLSACCLSLLSAVPCVAATVEAEHGAVAAEHRLASEAGVEILKAGGNAVDAAVAAALATGVVNPSSSGLGGGGFLVAWDARRGAAIVLDFREAAPAASRRDMYVDDTGKVDAAASKIGGLAVAVPGEPAGLALAIERHGRLPLAKVAEPAIRLARDGFVVEAHLAGMIEAQKAQLAADPGLARVFLQEDGSPVRAGETLKRPQLAATIEKLATSGSEPFYGGEVAAAVVEAAAARGGILTGADLASYKVREREPVRAQFRGATIVTMPPPSSGGGVLAQALAVLEGFDLRKLGQGSAGYLHLLAETCKAVFADRAIFYGDSDFVPVPLARLLSREHAEGVRRRLKPDAVVPSRELAPPVQAASDAGTSNISVIDADGGAAALTTSVNTAFGSMVSVPGYDIILNNTMDDFSAQPGVPNAFGLVGSEANAIAPGKRPLSSMTPTIVLKDDRVRIVAGGSGGPLIITSTLQTLLGVLEFDRTIGAAVDAPRVHHQWMPELLMVEPAVEDAQEESLRRLGHKLMPLTSKASVTAVEAVGMDGRRVVRAASDSRKGGVPAGY